MEQIALGNSGLHSTRIGFGCSAVLGRCGKTESLKALHAAWDEGIRLFDTARSYGYGESEGLLGAFLDGRRSQAVVATKFGILPAPQSAWKQVAKTVARKILSVAPSARSLLQRGAASQFSANQFTIAVLNESLDLSLRNLRTDYVDLLFLHAAPAAVLDQDDLLEALGRLVEAGKVRVAGISANADVIHQAMERQTRPLRAMQFPCNVFDLAAMTVDVPASEANPILIANHPFGGVGRVQRCREMLQNLVKNHAIDAVLCEKLGALDDATLADVVLNVILCETGIHAVVPAMMRVEHIRANVQAVERSRFTSEEIRQIRRAL